MTPGAAHALCSAAEGLVPGTEAAGVADTGIEAPFGFPEEDAKFLAVALPWVSSGTGVSHVLIPLTR
jgi:hypothetical protein